MSTKTQLIFDHIPKTAGVSINAALSQLFGESGALRPYTHPHHLAVASTRVRPFISGHLWFVPGEPLSREWYYATVLRDPIDRFLSQYFHNVRAPADLHSSDPQVAAGQRYDLEKYVMLSEAEIVNSYTNVQAVHFARRVTADPYLLTDRELLQAAIESLSEYDLVGSFDNIPAFLAAVCRDFKRTEPKLPRLNSAPNRPPTEDLPSGAIQRLVDANQVDRQLLRRMADRFPGGEHASGAAATRSTRIGTSHTQQQVSLEQSGTPKHSGVTSFGSRAIEILSATCLGSRTRTPEILSGDELIVAVECGSNVDEADLTLGIEVRDAGGMLVYGTNSRLLGLHLSCRADSAFTVRLALDGALVPGSYRVSIALHRGTSHLGRCYHWVNDATSFEVVGYRSDRFEGLFDLRSRIEVCDAHPNV